MESAPPLRHFKSKRPKLDFSTCLVQPADDVPANLVQISAPEDELQRRIKCFVEKKREEIDINNILDFTTHKRLLTESSNDDAAVPEENVTCARTSTTIVKQEHSNCHLRVRRVENRTGPQLKTDYAHTLDNLTGLSEKIKEEPSTNKAIKEETPDGSNALNERLQNMEQHVGLSKGSTKRLYTRIKALEDRLLHLESLSPEYKHFTANAAHSTRSAAPRLREKQKTYTVEDLDAIIAQTEQKLQHALKSETTE